MLLKNTWVNDEIKEEIRKYMKTNDDENKILGYESVSSVAQSGPAVCDPMHCSMPGLPVHRQLPEFTPAPRVYANSHPLSR